MGINSKIEWTDSTWNVISGCTKISAGCKNCYAERIAPRIDVDFSKIELHPEKLDQPLHWRKPRKIFLCSMSDLFHEQVPDDFIARVFGAMSEKHIYQILTKRPGRMKEWFSKVGSWEGIWTHNGTAPEKAYDGTGIIIGCHWPKPNVWLGISAENQETYDLRVSDLYETPAAVRFLSIEPMLGPIKLFCVNGRKDPAKWWGNKSKLTWVICGGESGPEARPLFPNWVREIRDQCEAASIPFFFKQWGRWKPICPESEMRDAETYEERKTMLHYQLFEDPVTKERWWFDGIGKNKAGRELDCRIWNEMPERTICETK